MVLLVIVFGLGTYLGIWTGDLKGDDAYWHVSTVDFVYDYFPRIMWYPNAFSGYSPFEARPLTFYILAAGLRKLTGLPAELVVRAILLCSVMGLVLSVYLMARVLELPSLIALALSLLPLTATATLNWIVVGGAYTRIPALPPVFFAITLAYIHVREVARGCNNRRIYLAAIATMTTLALLHPLVWLATLLMLSLALTLSFSNVMERLRLLLRMFLPVVGLTMWLYLPLVLALTRSEAPMSFSLHDTTPMNWRWLLYLPHSREWSIDLGPIIVPFVAIVMCLVLLVLISGAGGKQRTTVERAMFAGATVAVLYCLAFGWLHMPTSLYVMSSYDHVIWLGISGVILIAFGLSILMRTEAGGWKGRLTSTKLEILFAVITIVALIPSVRFLKWFTQDWNALNPRTQAYGLRKVVDVAKLHTPEGFRLYVNQRRITSWVQHTDPSLQVTGGRDLNSIPHRYFLQWADSTVSYRLNLRDIRSIYFDDAPQVVPRMIGGPENFYSSMFWLDWYAASGAIFLPTIYPQRQTLMGYERRPQFFQGYNVDVGGGQASFVRYADSSPILVSPSAPAVAILSVSSHSDLVYAATLELLSSLNLNSRLIIPVKLPGIRELNQFDSVLLDEDDYLRHRVGLEEYAVRGANVVVVKRAGHQRMVVRLKGLGLSLTTVAVPVLPPHGAYVIAESSQGPVAYRQPVGKGTITVSGLSPEALADSDSVVAPILLVRMIAPGIMVARSSLDLTKSAVTWKSASAEFVRCETHPTLKNDAECKRSSRLVRIQMNSNWRHNQVNWTVPVGNRFSPKSAGILVFSLWQDGKIATPIAVTLEQTRPAGYLYYDLPYQSWKGWKQFAVPLSAFKFKEKPNIQQFDGITFVFNQDLPFSMVARERHFALGSVGLVILGAPPEPRVLHGEWTGAGEFRVHLDGQTRILWKESYSDSWSLEGNGGHELDYYFAGPGLIYAVTDGERSAVFEARLPNLARIGLIVSTLSLGWLVLSAFLPPQIV